MCNSTLIHFGTLLTAAALLSSCAMPKGPLFSFRKATTFKKSPPLQSGVRYEVRKALASTVPFRPKDVKSYTFVLNTPKPPLMLAASPSHGTQMRVRTTAYCHDESDHIVYGTRNAIGTHLKYGTVRSAAADWSRFPVGTRFCIASEPGIIYEVDDYGSALVGTGTIDLYKPTRGMMNDWGVRHVDIRVVKWGSYERSMQLMRDRTRWPHVRQMIQGIQSRVGALGVPMQPVPLTASL
ncbi:MAG: 3D domain-containing protein [Verrucomicrobiaceae bacterium]|jgi:3D (Asp-Asp-Asp) domain-containing protein|nr:3D domain-containing protein [Verrucomicrobiaceae bacterium]